MRLRMTWMGIGIVDVIGVNAWLAVTHDPCIIWVLRSIKVTWGHWPRLTSQWSIANRHMFSGVSWGAESEFVVHCSQKRPQTTSSPSPWSIIVIRRIWILTVTAITASEGDAVLLRSTTQGRIQRIVFFGGGGASLGGGGLTYLHYQVSPRI